MDGGRGAVIDGLVLSEIGEPGLQQSGLCEFDQGFTFPEFEVAFSMEAGHGIDLTREVLRDAVARFWIQIGRIRRDKEPVIGQPPDNLVEAFAGRLRLRRPGVKPSELNCSLGP